MKSLELISKEQISKTLTDFRDAYMKAGNSDAALAVMAANQALMDEEHFYSSPCSLCKYIENLDGKRPCKKCPAQSRF